MRTLVTEYLMLGLRFGRLVPGFVDSYTGDPRLRARVDAEERPDPARLASAAARLRARLDQVPLSRRRRTFLEAQLRALECSGRKLAGSRMSFRGELREYFQVEVSFGDQDEYRRAHAELDELLTGGGPLADRLAAFRESTRVPPDHLERCVRVLSGALRQRVRGVFGLPPGETVEYRIVTGEPWSGLHSYLGNHRSRVVVNADSTVRMAGLAHLVAHEAYPGHHTQDCHTDRFPDDPAPSERSMCLLNTPQSLMAEGLAELGLVVTVGPGWGGWLREVFAELGLHLDGERAERLDAIMNVLRPVRQDAALMLHEYHADVDDVLAYLRRWLLVSEEKARQLVRFLSHPSWRAYTTTYVEGRRLLSSWLDARPPTVSAAQRYAALLSEPPTPRTVAERVPRAEQSSRVLRVAQR
ncbi:hypothetical protein FHX42_000203 [Saccharopolyspora lacisalsi]|uniref:DUF885 domain-containing protein n=1 Tax=Halosaccharopolyspora lacisalsi TaxID=1000566 RepID=A0A839DMY7_9PSEU|nr:hypothetical protein [Halosaccharopolyspora lacisalsi]